MSTNVPEHLSTAQSIVRLPVQWGDMDSMGHVNNAVHIRWLESSRIAHLEKAGLFDLMKAEKLGPILAAISCTYKRQLTYPDAVQIGCEVTKIGRSSITLTHIICSESQDAVVAEGESVVVVFDYQKQRPTRVPDDIRHKLEAITMQ